MVHMYCKSYLQSQANLSFESAGQICAFRGRPYESANRKRKNAFAHTLYWLSISVQGLQCTTETIQHRLLFNAQERVQSISRVQGPPSLIASMRSPLECMHKNVLHFQFALSNLLFQKMKTCMRKFLAVSFMLFRCYMRRYERRLTILVLSVTFESRLGP